MSHGSVMAHYPVSVLDVRDLSVQVSSELGVQTVVDQLQFSITEGETFALVGESGCGKSMTALSLLRLLPDAAQITDGQVQFEGSDLNQWPEAALRTIRGRRISMIFQEPSTSLNPIMSIGDQLLEVILRHTAYRGQEALQNAVSWLERVGIAQAATRINDYPFQFSGGQKQRIMIAMALAAEPSLLIADEPTTALDVTIQAQILQLLKELQAELGMAILLISHDLGVVAEMAHHVALMYAGKIVSCGSATAFFDDVQHPYAQHLFSVLPHVTKRGRSLGQAWSGEKMDGSSTVQKEYTPPDPSAPLVLDIQNVSVSFPQRAGLLRRIQSWTPVVKDLNVSLKAGHTLALVGESGCGKTTLSKAILGLLDASVRITGKALIDQGDLLSADASQLKSMRQDIQIVFQDPFSSLNPRHRVGDILEEGLLTLMPNQSAQKREQRIAYLLDRVGLPRESVNRYPHEFSGGQRQRIAIARALAVEPKVLICDEPTSALDVSVQAQILNLLNELQQETGLAYLFITHNFAVVEYFAHHVAVMHEGKIIESGETLDVLAHPQHDYTKRLLASVPKLAVPVS